MEFSENWLREWINPNISCKKLCEQLTELGIEVETVNSLFKKNIYHGLVIGKILSFISHPNADDMNIIDVQISQTKSINIIYEKVFICSPGMKIVVAPIGSVLLDNKKIKICNIKGKMSEGKICLFSELGIFHKYNSIIELPLDAPIGTNIKDYLFNDNIIKINIGPNRPDCFSIIGLAREISIKNNLKLSMMQYDLVKPVIDDKLPIFIKSPKICPRYFCRVIKNINAKINTPFWIREKLRRSNVASVNIIIDVIHYIAIEIGVPLHVFDLDNIQGNIILRLSTLKDEIILSNNVFIQPNDNLFVIADDDKVLSVGGNFNTISAEINDSTRNILIGSAFLNICINYKEKFFYEEDNYITDYYKRGIDFNKQEYAIEYATNLLLNIIDGQAGPLNYQCNNDYFYKDTFIIIHRIKLNQIIGFEIDNTTIVDILTRLGYQIREHDNCWEVIVPAWRFDIHIEEDVIGDILRVYGYNQIPILPLSSQKIINKHEYDTNYLMSIKNLLISKGYYEIITYGFVNPIIQNMLFPNINQLLLLNPISKEMSAMR
ncbi:MAG TPA: phenylalanine--tRNA ligase subunit beta, partial [Buchnera sp. (in: enterobacteria)]|nr:phenylalanine--tRNA ligase subunit beta [Buchnera sp. (in: enterobacteria)]